MNMTSQLIKIIGETVAEFLIILASVMISQNIIIRQYGDSPWWMILIIGVIFLLVSILTRKGVRDEL
jgi:quinol-cytochrome oxidoreductase complex cytochrome b subunit